MQNGHSSKNHETVAEIKAAAKEQALRARGASATSLLKTARDQVLTAKASEGTGELREALSALTKAVSLITMLMDSSEFKLEMQPGKKGVLTREFLSFQQVRLQVIPGFHAWINGK
jgi:ubiquitin carboxyl-terminal hydrolase 8